MYACSLETDISEIRMSLACPLPNFIGSFYTMWTTYRPYGRSRSLLKVSNIKYGVDVGFSISIMSYYFPAILTNIGKGVLQISHSKYFVLKYIVQPLIFLYILLAIHYFKQFKCIYSHEPLQVQTLINIRSFW